MTFMKAPAIDTYREAIKELTNAVNALDQAAAMLKDIGLDKFITSKGSHRLNTQQLCWRTDELLFDLQTVRCSECDEPMTDRPACLEGCCGQKEK